MHQSRPIPVYNVRFDSGTRVEDLPLRHRRYEDRFDKADRRLGVPAARAVRYTGQQTSNLLRWHWRHV
jgi:hypothetical protein